jgi:hypothetical protein
MSRLIDMTGRKIGRLIVTGYAGSKFRGRAARASWTCRCSCGITFVATGAHLREGQQSCGCDVKTRRELIEAELNDNPDRSNRQVAKKLGVSPTTVGKTRKAMAAMMRAKPRARAARKRKRKG